MTANSVSFVLFVILACKMASSICVHVCMCGMFAADVGVNVTIVAHSMSGIVARAVFMLKQYVPGSVHTVVTIGTPHQWLPLPLDPALVVLHNTINEFWR